MYKLMDEIEKQRKIVREQNADTLLADHNLTELHVILDNLPDDCELASLTVSEITSYVFARIHVGNTHAIDLRYSTVSKALNIGTGGFLPKEKLSLGHKFWQDPEVIRVCRIWIEKRP